VIPAIDPGIGLKEDRPAPRVPASENPAFSQVLHRTRDPEQPQQERSVRDEHPPGDQRARKAYGEQSRAADRARRRESSHGAQSADRDRQDTSDDKNTAADRSADKAADKAASTATGKAGAKGKAAGKAEGDEKGAKGKPGDELNAAAQQAGNPALQLAAAAANPLQAEAVQPGTEALAFTDLAPDNRFGLPEDGKPIGEQIGDAAYRLGPHSAEEAALADANGIVLPGSLKAKLAAEGVKDAKQAALKQVEQPWVQIKTQAPFATAADALLPSKAGKGETKDGLSYKEQIALQTAQARNDVLSRLAASSLTGDTGGDKGLGHNASDSLRQQLQFQGLLARDARVHTLQPTSPNAPQTTVAGLVAPASTQLDPLRHTPNDEAAQQRTIEHVATEARWLINNNRQEVTLRLSPEHLGSLHMKVQHEDGVFQVHLTVDTAAAKHLLESNLQDLRNRLVAQHPGGEFLFNVDVRHGNDQPSLYSRAARTEPIGIGHRATLDEAPVPGMAGRVLAQSGLSIYV
jgi:flagellar hook-length control protein FliK